MKLSKFLRLKWAEKSEPIEGCKHFYKGFSDEGTRHVQTRNRTIDECDLDVCLDVDKIEQILAKLPQKLPILRISNPDKLANKIIAKAIADALPEILKEEEGK